MPRITRVYTRTGDERITALGTGERVPKDSPRLEAYGTVDELDSRLGVALSKGLDASLAQEVRGIQNELFHLGSDLCVPEADKAGIPVPEIGPRHVSALEALMDRLSEELIPARELGVFCGRQRRGGPSPRGSHGLPVARSGSSCSSVRLERIGADAIVYLNRLSDALFVMARYENKRRGVPDVLSDSRA